MRRMGTRAQYTVVWAYDAETEKRCTKQRLETFGRDVRAVTTTSTV